MACSLSYSTAAPSTSHFQFSSVTPSIGHLLHKPFTPKSFENIKITTLKFSSVKTRASIDGEGQFSTTPSVLVKEELKPDLPNKEVEECIGVLKNAAKTRKVAQNEILSAFSVLKKAKIDPSCFLETLGGTNSPGRTWMLIFTAEKGMQRGKYFPITAIQRFDAAGKRIENGVYLGPLGFLTFEGRLSWNKRVLAFIFEKLRLKIGPLNPFEISFKGKEDEMREPSNKEDPFFVWFYIDEEIAVARGKSGGTAFWVRCRQIINK